MKSPWMISLFYILMLGMLVSCATTPTPPPEPKDLRVLPDLPVPTNLQITAADRQANLIWELDKEPDQYALGYNVYVDTKTLRHLTANQLPSPRATWPPYQLDSDTVNSWTNYHLKNLKNGTRYFVHVRVTGANARISYPSNEVMIVPRPEGHFKLYEVSSNHYSAFDFSEQKELSSTDQQADIVYDARKGVGMLMSPHLRRDGLRKTGITDMKDLVPFDQLTNIEDGALDTFNEESLAVVGHTIVIKTADDHYAKLLIEHMGGKAPNRFIEGRYCYQLLPNFPQF